MLPKLTNLHKLNISDVSGDYANALHSSLQILLQLVSLTIQGSAIPFDSVITAFSNQRCLKKFVLYGKLNCRQLPRNDLFPQQLEKLVFLYSELEHEPMATLEKMQHLKYLVLGDTYQGKKMICSATGFPQLLSLDFRGSDELEEWMIEENAMPYLRNLKIRKCPNLKMIPEGLKNVQLDKLVLEDVSEELKTRITENTIEDWHKIQHVPKISIK
ncbi:probable disease resistance protein At1g58602 [Dioscorea cayenensis subsp. rotundata]|uniref:Probable disease resistance protein At1g58602 n=1 Tax=Dioscorea cayennensis subsp. rotundata TaxID=55577 RepID=A0AB40D056_DIOCR|nr:probable disease resistance protein At1g58602 [Dioscorea cayenensis subsp. rotundata]